MDSTSKCTKNEDDSSSIHILEYYRKYSQNQELPKYFSGTSLSYLPKINDDFMKNDLGKNSPDIIIQSDAEILLSTTNSCQDEKFPTSPASSDHKLEWDSLADVGYTNCHMTEQKNPSLSSSSQQAPQFQVSSHSLERDNVKMIIFPYSSGSEESGEKDYYSSSSCPEAMKDTISSISYSDPIIYSSMDVQKQCTSSSESIVSERIVNFKNTLACLKKKIGLPDAHSTPNITEKNKDDFPKRTTVKRIKVSVDHIIIDGAHHGSSDPCQSQGQSTPVAQFGEINHEGEAHKPKNHNNEHMHSEERIINLYQTKPLTIGCISLQPKFEDKTIQTSFGNVHAAAQTLPNLDEQNEESVNHVPAFKHCSLSESLNKTDDFNVEIIQPKFQTLAHHKSFECINRDSSKSSSGISKEACDIAKKVESSDNSRMTVGTEESYSVGIDCCQTSTEDSRDYLEKYIYLFQRILRSKKYDSATKKRYLKKIMRKITEAKYLDECSTSSDLYLDKKKSNSGMQSLSDCKIFPASTESNEEKLLETSTASPRLRAQMKPSHINQSHDEALPFPHICTVNVGDIKQTMKTLANKESSIKNQNPDNFQVKSNYSDNKSFVEQDDSSSSSIGRHWKDNKTISEKILDRINSSRDRGYFINVTNEERKYLNDCISTELKQLKHLRSVMKKQTEDLVAKKTEILPKMVSAYNLWEKGESETVMRRNFVIETDLGASSSRNKYFILDGKKYVVEKNSTDESDKTIMTGHVLADLKVLSSDTTTKVKVSTFCEVCKLSPCTCLSNLPKKRDILMAPQKHENLRHDLCSACPSSMCSVCDTYPCSCDQNIKCNDNYAETQGELTCRKCSSLFCTLRGNQLGKLISDDLTRLKENSGESTADSSNCSNCRDCSHKHGKRRDSSSATSSGAATISSLASLNGSLNKLFLTCRCNKKKKCNCGFVEKLLRHFEKEKLVDLKYSENKISQTENLKKGSSCDNIDIGVQVGIQNQISQVGSGTQSCTKNVGIQTEITLVENKQTEKTEDCNAEKVMPQNNEQHHVELPEANTESEVIERTLLGNFNNISQRHSEKSINDNGQYTSNSNQKDIITDSTGSDQKLMSQSNIENPNENHRESSPKHAGINISSKSSPGSTYEESSNRTISTNATSALTCICCKKKTNIADVSMLRSTNQEYALCHHCLDKRPILTSVCYTGPTNGDFLDANISSDCFRRIEEYCTCKKSRSHSSYCCHCQLKLKKTVKNQNSIAYTLTLENETPRKFRSNKNKKKQLEEIKVKVLYPPNEKICKNEENLTKRNVERLNIQESSGSETWMNKEDDKKSTGRKNKSERNITIQEYLRRNRPDFMDSAEYRRLTVISHMIERQSNKDENKLRFIEKNAPTNGKRQAKERLFTEREMKNITNKNYKKLPEVQQKLTESRNRRLRDADKFIVDLFKKNIQGSVLRGKRSFPLNSSIVNMQV